MVVGSLADLALPGEGMMAPHRWEVDRRECKTVEVHMRFDVAVDCMVGNRAWRKQDGHTVAQPIGPLTFRGGIRSRAGL